MAAGDIWLRTNNYAGHLDPAGTMIFDRTIPLPELGSTTQFFTANVAHDGEALWLCDGAERVYRVDPATLAVLNTYVFTDAAVSWGLSVAVESTGNVVVLGNTAVELLEINDGLVLQSYLHTEHSTAPTARIAIGPGRDQVFMFDADVSLVARTTIATEAYDEFTLADPPGYSSVQLLAVAPKSDGGFWVSWTTDEVSALFVEYDSSGVAVTTVPMPSVSPPYYDYFTCAIDVDASDNLVAWIPVYAAGSTFTQLIRLQKATGALTVLNDQIADTHFGFGSVFIGNYVHVERALTPAPMLSGTRVRFS